MGRFLSYGATHKYVATAALLAAIAFASCSRYIYHDFLIVPYFAIGLASILILQLRASSTPWDAVAVTLLALTLLFVNTRLLGFVRAPMAVLSLFGLSSLLVLGLRSIWRREQENLLPYVFLPALALATCIALTGLYVEWSSFWHIRTFDVYLYSFDCSLGGQYTFWLARCARRFAWTRPFVALTYEVVLLPVAAVYAALLRDRRRALRAFTSFLLVGPLAIICFCLFPATGPVYAFRSFPLAPVPDLEIARLIPVQVLVTGPHNAMPSLHFAWVLLACWNARAIALWLRVACYALAVLTAFATLATGEHYAVDLLVAVPFALGVFAISRRAPRHATRRAVTGGFGVTAAWLFLLRFANRAFWISPVVPWAAVVATLVISVYLYAGIIKEDAEMTPAKARAAEVA